MTRPLVRGALAASALVLAACARGRGAAPGDAARPATDTLASTPALSPVPERDPVIAREAPPPTGVPAPVAPTLPALDAPPADGPPIVEPASVIRWSGDVTVTGRGRAVDVRVTWTVLAPDSAIIESRPAASGAVTRTVILAGRRGWALEDGHRRPLGAGLLRAEIADLWLWHMLRAPAPSDSTCTVRALPSSHPDSRADVVQCAGRPAVIRHVTANGRVARVEADVLDPVRETTRRVVYEREGADVGGGLPATVRVAHDGTPFATIRIGEVVTAVRVDRAPFRP